MRNALILAAWMVAGLPLGAVSADTTSEGLLGHWTFDRLADGRTEDASPNARHAQVHGAIATEGVRGKALGFDGDGDFVSLGDLGEHDAVTMAFWVKGQDDGRRDRWQGLVTSDGWEPGVWRVPISWWLRG